MTSPLAVVAVGGNALLRDNQHMALADQYDAVCATATHVADDDVSFAAGNSMP